MTTTRFLWTTLATLGGVVAAIGLQATAQDPGPDVTVVEAREDGTLIQRSADGAVRRVTGTPNPLSINTIRPADMRMVYQYPGGPAAQDEQSQKLLEQEQAAAQEVRRMADNLLGIDAPEAQQIAQKKELREKLAEVFDLQQQRRTREIAKIEERLGKLKETLKKREAVKDSIVDRRLETMTGGVDELGWEETFPPGPAANNHPNFAQPGPGRPLGYGLPSRAPLPPPVAPAPVAPPARDPNAAPPAR